MDASARARDALLLAAGQLGLDQHQVRRWTSWHRFATLAIAALAVLAICAAPPCLHDYNHHRPHTAIGGASPITRLNNLAGHHC